MKLFRFIKDGEDFYAHAWDKESLEEVFTPDLIEEQGESLFKVVYHTGDGNVISEVVKATCALEVEHIIHSQHKGIISFIIEV